MSSLQGKVALVTGASKGIGEAIARELAARGAAVAVNYSSNRAAAEKVVAEIKSGGVDAIAVQGDVADATSAQTLVDTVADQLGPSTSWSTMLASMSFSLLMELALSTSTSSSTLTFWASSSSPKPQWLASIPLAAASSISAHS
jgi:NAD(P)-dependent dehydrogenase (short-subunit alcohol dehydrogenase family)